MKKLYLAVLGLLATTSFIHAQNTTTWQWALSGGASIAAGDELGGYDFNTEQVYDIQVGSDNNYYILANMTNGSPKLKGQPVTVYGHPLGGNNIFLFSTTSNGAIRWSQAIGGADMSDASYKIALDKKNNVYVGVYVGWGSGPNLPVHFSPTDTLPLPVNPSINSDGYKTSFIAKYNSNGQFISKRAMQGDVNMYTSGSQISNILIDSNNNLHIIVGLLKGTHLDGNVIVPPQYEYDPVTGYNIQFHLVKWDSSLNYISSMVLPVTGAFINHSFNFAYDQLHNRYYIAGSRSMNATSQVLDLAYANKPFINRSYLLAINGANGNELWRREIYSDPVNGQLPINLITSLAVDANSDVYIGGLLWKSMTDNVKILDPHNPATTTYTLNPAVYTNMPMLVKFNLNGAVQWAKTPTAFAANFTGNAMFEPKGIAFRGNEVALGSSEAYFEWDGITQNNPQFFETEPALLRFNKQTGATLGVHPIKGDANTNEYMRAVAVDKEGNYVVGGAFSANLFWNNTLGITPLITNGYNDFFVAKLKMCSVPVASFTSSNTGAAYTFNYSGSSPYTSISWNFGDGSPVVNGNGNPSHTYAASGNYNVCVTVTDACGSNTQCKGITVTAPNTSIASTPGFENVTVFPNPAQSQLHINHAEHGTIIKLYDAVGKLVLTEPITKVATTIDLSALAPGIYVLHLKNSAGHDAAMKIIKQ